MASLGWLRSCGRLVRPREYHRRRRYRYADVSSLLHRGDCRVHVPLRERCSGDYPHSEWQRHYAFARGLPNGPPRSSKMAAVDVRAKDAFDMNPLHFACVEGRLDVAKWLYDNGAAEDIRYVSDTCDYTPMNLAIAGGHLDLAKWIFTAGGAKDIRDTGFFTPIETAVHAGHLHIVKWLFRMGVADDVRNVPRRQRRAKYSILGQAAMSDNKQVALWLVLQGVANDIEGTDHVTREILRAGVVGVETMAALSGYLSKLLGLQSNFAGIVLPATSLDDSVLPPASRSPLRMLRGSEGTLLRLVADFAGILQGRELRNAREAAAIASGV